MSVCVCVCLFMCVWGGVCVGVAVNAIERERESMYEIQKWFDIIVK